MQKQQENPYLRPGQVAKLLNVRLGRVYVWINKGVLPAKRLGGSLLVLRSDAEAMLVDVKPAGAVADKPAFVPHQMAVQRLKAAGLMT